MSRPLRPSEAIFDAFIALYDSQRPDWVTASQLDLRPGGRWSVPFQVPDGHRVRLMQQGFPTVQARDDFAGAWPDVLGEVARRTAAG
jgi:hypothetical protein